MLVRKMKIVSRTAIIRLVSIVLSCISCLVSVLIYSFIAFIPAVKAQFNLTQTEVSAIASAVMITGMFMFPAGVVYDKFGMAPTITIGMVLTTIGFSGLWLTSLAPHSSPASFYCLILSGALAVSVIASVVMITAMFMFPAGVVYDKLGMAPTITIGMVFTTIGFSGLWLTSLAPHSSPASLYCLIISGALAGHGRTYISIMNFGFVLATIPIKYRGGAILVVELAGDFGHFLFSLVYENSFSRVNGKDVSPLNQNLTKYLLIGSILTFITNMIIVTVLPIAQKYLSTETDKDGGSKNKSQNQNAEEKTTSGTHNSYQLGSTEITIPDIPKKSRFYHDILTKTFMFITTAFALNISISSFSQTNITLVTQSLNLSRLDYYILIIQRLAVTTSKTLTTGAIMITKRFTFSREILIALSSLVITLTQVLLMIKAESETILVVAYACIYLVHGVTVVTCINMVSTIFSFERIGSNVGFMMACIPMLSTIIQMIFGKLYDSEITIKGSIYCTGKHCTYRFYQVTTGLGAVSVIMTLSLLIMQIRKKYKTKM